MTRTVVVNRHVEPFDVYIGRGTPFGNPYHLKSERERDAAIALYRNDFLQRIQDDPSFKAQVEALRGKRLGCSCKPKRCHGDVIVAYLEGTP